LTVAEVFGIGRGVRAQRASRRRARTRGRPRGARGSPVLLHDRARPARSRGRADGTGGSEGPNTKPTLPVAGQDARLGCCFGEVVTPLRQVVSRRPEGSAAGRLVDPAGRRDAVRSSGSSTAAASPSCCARTTGASSSPPACATGSPISGAWGTPVRTTSIASRAVTTSRIGRACFASSALRRSPSASACFTESQRGSLWVAPRASRGGYAVTKRGRTVIAELGAAPVAARSH
jgi:hypothetical protein